VPLACRLHILTEALCNGHPGSLLECIMIKSNHNAFKHYDLIALNKKREKKNLGFVEKLHADLVIS
jgi:hypothetical protein